MDLEIHTPDWATHIVSDLTDMERNPHPVDAAKVSSFTLELPDDVYFEYAFLDANGKMRADPDIDKRADNPWYPEVSAVFGPTYEPDTYAEPKLEAQGEVRRHRLESKVLSQTRRLTTYTPKGYEAEPLPTVLVQDGTAYYRVARLADVLETLLADELVRPAHLLFVEPLDRAEEYRFNPAYRQFICDEVIPFADNTLAITQERIAMGASLGGLMSATLALHHPELFQTVVAQSGAFLGTPEDMDFYRSEDSWLAVKLEAEEAKDVRWYVECGTLEWLSAVNRRIRDALEGGNYDYQYLERHAGHNWTNWKNGLSHALRFALARKV